MNSRALNIVVICMLSSVALYFHSDKLTSFPRNIHAWAQSDHLAISLGYLENGFDFFHPQTFHYNHQFPNAWKVPSETTITAVDFPIHNYVVAIFMKLFNNSSPMVYRIYLLLYSIIGLFFFFRFSLEIGNEKVISFLLLLIAATSPIFVYYQAGFLPTIPCLSNTFIALYFLSVHIKKDSKKSFALMLLFFTLATLSRTSFAVPFIALLCYETYNLLIRKKRDWYKWHYLSISAIFIIGYAIYNSYLRSNYGSIFLSEPRPPVSFQDLLNILREVNERWNGHFFNKVIVWLFLLIPILPLLGRYVLKLEKSKTLHDLWFYYLIWVIGSLCFSFLMITQFENHDYYFLDTLFLPLLTGLSLSLTNISLPSFKFSSVVYSGLILACAYPLISYSKEITYQRNNDYSYDIITGTIDAYDKSEDLLDSLNVSNDSKILALEALAPNIPFMLMKRKGYASMIMENDVLNDLLKWDYNYAVIQNELYVSNTYHIIPESLEKLERIGGNKFLTVCKYSSTSNPKSLKSLLGLDSMTPIVHYEHDFENANVHPWAAHVYSTKNTYRGKYSGFVHFDSQYGLEFSVKLKDLPSYPSSLFFNGYLFKYSDKECEMMLIVKSNEKIIHYRGFSLNNQVDKNEWQEFNLYSTLPDNMPQDAEIALFVFNHSGNQLYFDDLALNFY